MSKMDFSHTSYPWHEYDLATEKREKRRAATAAPP
jgi:hypothetical protein